MKSGPYPQKSIILFLLWSEQMFYEVQMLDIDHAQMQKFSKGMAHNV